MRDSRPGVERMIKMRAVERVEPNPEHAAAVVEIAHRHIETARLLSDLDDPAMAFTAAYDAARKAMTAVLALHGLRVRPVGGAHRNTGLAAAEFVADRSLREFEWMRQVRNATEYPSSDRPTASRQDVDEGVAAAEAIVATCTSYVRRQLRP